jgi:hypothetical protein
LFGFRNNHFKPLATALRTVYLSSVSGPAYLFQEKSMRRCLLLCSYLLLSHSPALAQACPALQIDPSSMQAELISCAQVQAEKSTQTVQTATTSTMSYYLRTSNGGWLSGSLVADKVRIPNPTPQDPFVEVAGGASCDSPASNTANSCPPLALLVQTAIPPATGDFVSPSWRKLFSWDGNKPHVVHDLSDFFHTDPQVRISINGKTPPVVEEADSSGTDDPEKKIALEKKKTKVNRLWADWTPDPGIDTYVAVYRTPEGCRYYDPDDKTPIASFLIPALQPPPQPGPNNGITIGSPKIFDTFALRQKLAVTSAQLASISPFSQAQITAQLGSFQGITRDQSFIAAQLTTSPTPGIVGTTSPATGNTVTTTGAPVQGVGTVTTACPAGYVASIAAQGTVTCVLAPAGTSGGPVTVTTTNGNPGTETVQTANLPTAQTVTTTPSLQGTVPTAPTLNPLAAPTNVGVSAADMLNEQTQLSSELTTLQTLLQGAVSDQLLLTNKRVIGQRAQATIGFPISVETPKRLKGAVAEFRVLILPLPQSLTPQPVTPQPVSIVNLLPSEKTYNVARITSKASQFGFGVAMQPISFGITTGKSKDRLYLAKEADTLALQYPPGGYLGDEGTYEPTVGQCDEWPPHASPRESYDLHSAVMFGWQFRPVLGAAAVSAGRRTVFAQLALPEADGFKFKVQVWVQTRWRRYDQKTQLAAGVYQDDCQWEQVTDPLAFDNPVTIRNVQVSDVGQGMLRFQAKGEFFSSTGQMRSGSVNVAPTYFDGYTLEYFGVAKDVLSNGDVQLLDEAFHGKSLAIRQKESAKCFIDHPKLSALPLPDGNSFMQLEYDRPNYQPDTKKDGPQHPLVLIGTDVYGLRDKPLQAADPHAPANTIGMNEACSLNGNKAHCAFTFLASTESISSARNFLVRDPAWDSQGAIGPIMIDPTFTKIEASTKPAKSDDSGGDSIDPKCIPKLTCDQQKTKADKAKADAAKPSTWYLVSGTNLSALEWAAKIVDDTPANYCGREVGCLQILSDGSDGPKHLSPADIKIASNSNVWVKLSKNAGGVHVLWSRDDHPYSEWDLAIKEDKTAITADPAVLYQTDSRAVTFTGADFSKVKQVFFEGKPLDLVTDATKSKLIVQVTSAVTAKLGHKELTAKVPDDKDKTKTKTIALPLEVVRH